VGGSGWTAKWPGVSARVPRKTRERLPEGDPTIPPVDCTKSYPNSAPDFCTRVANKGRFSEGAGNTDGRSPREGARARGTTRSTLALAPKYLQLGFV
jgi:hypothetical protein